MQDYPNFSVMVVDNGSTDDTVQLVREQYPMMQVIENRANLGFAGGNNVGLRLATSAFVVLINPDVVLAPDWLSQLIAAMAEDSTVGIAGCKVYYPGGRILQHAGGYVTFPQALPGHYGLSAIDRGQYDQVRDVDYVIGAAMAIRREVVESIGLFDERFFLYFEDVDYCRRTRSAGFRVIYAPSAHLVHLESPTTQKGSAFYFGQMHAGRWRYLLKYYTVEELLDATFPTEHAWLAQRTHEERLGLQYAYARAKRQLARLWRSRFGSGSQRGRRDFDRVGAALVALRGALWQPLPVEKSDGDSGFR